ncbi:hypothetical protein ACPW96_05140 [Micromonospora sp. DT81.3]|uniref:hypothetical protein n=1 Tax=Micromonospora sp. DT81.3 TaxID=3416523 RepID=UPI003CF917FD
MSRSFAALACAPLLALALVLAGCGADPGPDSAPDPADSPLSKYMMAVYGQSGDEEDWQKQAIEDNKKTEELVAQCMNEEGFEYIPQTNNMSFDAGTEWKPESEEWVAEYGYGAVNWPGRDDANEQEQVEDPNQDYLTGLSESEQMAYSESLWGPQPAEEDLAEDGSYSPTWEEQGCYGWASHEIRGDDPMQLEEHKPLMDALQTFWQKQSTAPELSEVDAEWADCMADGGHGGFAQQADAQNSIQDEMNQYYESQTEYVENDPELEEIGEREIALALVDLECREKTDYRAKAAEIQFELEEKFIADHKAELDALKADAEQGRK